MDADSAVDPATMISERLLEGAHLRLTRLGSLGQDMATFLANVSASGWSLPGLFAVVLASAGAALLVQHFARGALARVSPRLGRWSLLAAWLAMLAGVIAGWMVAVLAAPPGPARRSIIAFALLAPATLLMRDVLGWLTAAERETSTIPGLKRFAAGLSLAIGWAFAGAAVLTLLRMFQAGPGLRDLIATVIVALPVTALMVLAFWRGRFAVAYELMGAHRGSRLSRRFSACWPAIAMAFIVLAFLLSQIMATLDQPVRTATAVITVVLLLMAPHLDSRISRWAQAGLHEVRIAAPVVALRRTLRPAALTVVIMALLVVWSEPFGTLTGMAFSDMLRHLAVIGAVVLSSAYLLNLIGVAVDRFLDEERAPRNGGDEEHQPGAPQSRLGTVLPLLDGAAKTSIIVLTFLTVLLALGVNVWPLVTGLSVFGLAIGFGSQTLVKDIVSGLFFLFDDAFRLGEYVETSGAKGTVEKISIRSVSLRHPRGAVATIPYGQIGKITNHSRDWVIEKLTFRVAFDTDVDKVKKLFKTIGQDLMQDPELKPDLLEPFKSQGIGELEDGTLLIRAKFKAKAGRQFNTRKAVLSAVQKAFKENGIQAVPKPLSPVTK